MADTPSEDPSVRALREAIEADQRAKDEAYAELHRDLRAQLAAAARKNAADRRETARKLRALGTVVAPPRRKPPRPPGWRHEPPRGNGTALRRTLSEGAGIQDLRGLRGLTVRLFLGAGEAGLTPDELASLVMAQAAGPVRERFARLSDKAKNASDGLYFVRENQAALGVRVEKDGQRWRAVAEARP